MSALETAHVYTPVSPPEFTPTLRPLRGDREHAWVIHSWIEGYKNSPAMRRKTWADYKALDAPVLRSVLERADTRVTMAVDPTSDIACGFMVHAHWLSIDTVHWLYTARPFRGRGIMRQLLGTLRERLAYTHKARVVRGERRADERIADLLAARGVVVSYVPYQEWSR